MARAIGPGGFGRIDWDQLGGRGSAQATAAAARSRYYPNDPGGQDVNNTRQYGLPAGAIVKKGAKPQMSLPAAGNWTPKGGAHNTPSGSSAATGGGGPAAGMAGSTGIRTGPVISPQAMAYHANALRGTTAPAMANGALNQHLQSLMSGEMNRAATDFNTQAAYNNAQQQLHSQQAADQAQRGQYGVDASSYLSQLNDQDNVFRMILASLQGLTPPMSSPDFGLANLALG